LRKMAAFFAGNGTSCAPELSFFEKAGYLAGLSMRAFFYFRTKPHTMLNSGIKGLYLISTNGGYLYAQSGR
ncbi:hypothetical protein, partial [Brevibacillus nitrificans]|uniref:hypothetical protein n=1 Tax=Brevibacillus nitrificans TaxID=651560 RepID=UPI00286C0115